MRSSVLRHIKSIFTVIDTDDKREIGPRIIPRMIQQIFDEPDLSKDVRRKALISRVCVDAI